MSGISFTVIGESWGPHGDYAYCANPETREQARVYVDSIGETWVDIRRVPPGEYFPSERVTAFRCERPLGEIVRDLAELGYSEKTLARYAHRVRQR